MQKHCSNLQCFKEKTTKLNSQPARYFKNKIKKHKKRRRQFWKKKSNKKMEKNKKKTCGKIKAEFLTSSILKKNRQR